MQIPKSLVYETKQIFFELTESQGKTLILHGDLHHDNILFDKKRGWLAIDPKGIIGEAEIEVSAFLKNPVEHPKLYANEETIRNRVNIVVQMLNLNRERILLWCYTLTMIHSMWLIETKGSPKNWVDMAQLLKRII
jgi:streptomycin 6-kinase